MSTQGLDPAPSSSAARAAFAALGDATRLGLVTRLAHGPPHSIPQLASHSRLTRQGLTRHLRTLEHAGLLHSRRVGRESLFEFRPEPLQELSAYLKEVSKDWDEALGASEVVCRTLNQSRAVRQFFLLNY